MKNSVNRVTKKALSFLLAVAMMFSVFTVAITALANEVPVVYTVTEAKPAIPVKQGKVVDLNKIAVELGGDTYRGTELEWSTNDTTGGVIIGDGIIAVLGSDTYTVEAVSNTGEKKTIYLFETDENGNKVIYNHNFSSKDLTTNSEGLGVFTEASEWKVHMFHANAASSQPHIGGYADGIAAPGHSTFNYASVMFYLDPDSASGNVVSAFSDYTIETKVVGNVGGVEADVGPYIHLTLGEGDALYTGAKYVLASAYQRSATSTASTLFRYITSESDYLYAVNTTDVPRPTVGSTYTTKYTIVGNTVAFECDLDNDGVYGGENDASHGAYTIDFLNTAKKGTIGLHSVFNNRPIYSSVTVTVNFDISRMEEYFSDEEIYIVKADNAVLPMYEGQKLDLTKLFFEFDNGTVAAGSQIAWTTKDATGGIKVNNTDKSIILFNEGFYEVIAAYSKAGEPKTFYVATPDANKQVVIYNKTFTADDFDANGYLTEESEWYSSYNDNKGKFTEKTGAYGLYDTNDSTVIYLRPDSDSGKVVGSFRDITYEVVMRPYDQMNWWGYAAPIARVNSAGVIDASLANMTFVATYYSTLHPESAHTAQNHTSGQCRGIHNTMTTNTSVSAANSATVDTGIAIPTNTTSKYKMVLKGDTFASYINYDSDYVETTIALTEAQATAMASTEAGTIGVYSSAGYRAGIASVNVSIDVAQEAIDAIAARSSDIPLIPANKPYIPMEAKKNFDTSEVYFGFDSGKVVAGSDITWSTTDTTGAIKAEDSVITLFSGNFHEITATYGEETKTFYVVMPDAEGKATLMDYQFSEADAGVTIADGSSAFIGENDTWEVISNGGGVTSSYNAGRGLGLHGNSSFFVLLNLESPYGKLVSGFTDVIIDVRADGQAIKKWANSDSTDGSEGSFNIYGRFNSTNEIPGAPNNNKDTYVGYQQYFSNAVKGNVLLSKNATIPAAVLTTYNHNTSNYTIDMRLKLDGTTVTYWAKNGDVADFGEPLFTVTDSSVPTGKGTYGFYSSSMLRPTVKYFKVAIEIDEKQINTVAAHSSDLLVVSADKPAIPISVGKKVNVSNIYFEFDNGTVALGKDITWSTDDTTGGVMVADADKTIALLGGDVYAVNANFGAETKTFYVMQPDGNGDKVIYDKTFTAADVADGAFTADSEWDAKISSSGSIIAYVDSYSGVGVATSSGSIDSDQLYATLYLRPDSESGKRVSSFADMELEVVTYQSLVYNGTGGYLGPIVRYDVANGKHILAQHRVQGGASPATESLKLSAARLIVNGDYTGTITAQSYILSGKAANTITLAVNGNEIETAVNDNVANLSINATQADGIAASTKGTIGFNFGGTNRSVLQSAKVTISFSEEEIAMFANPAITSDLLIVKSTAPALPLNAGKSLNVSNIFFEFDSGKVVSGSLIEWSSKSTSVTVNNTADTITLIKDGNFEITASFGGESKTIYIVQPDAKNQIVLMDYQFSASDAGVSVADGSYNYFGTDNTWKVTSDGGAGTITYYDNRGICLNANSSFFVMLNPESPAGKLVSKFADITIESRADGKAFTKWANSTSSDAADGHINIYGRFNVTNEKPGSPNNNQDIYAGYRQYFSNATKGSILTSKNGTIAAATFTGYDYSASDYTIDMRLKLEGNTATYWAKNASDGAYGEPLFTVTDGNIPATAGMVGYYSSSMLRPTVKYVKVYATLDEALVEYTEKNSTSIDIIPANMPTLPVRENTKLSLKNLYFEFDNGTAVQGSQIDWSLTDLTGGAVLSNKDKTVTIFNNGKLEKLFYLEASYNGLEKTFYIFVPDANDEHIIYSKTFKAKDLYEVTGHGENGDIYQWAFTEESEWIGDSHISEPNPNIWKANNWLFETDEENIKYSNDTYIGSLSTLQWSGVNAGIAPHLSTSIKTKEQYDTGEVDENDEPIMKDVYEQEKFWLGDSASGSMILNPESESGKLVSTFKNIAVEFDVTPDTSFGIEGTNFAGPMVRVQFNPTFMDEDGLWLTDNYDGIYNGQYIDYETMKVVTLPSNSRVLSRWRAPGANNAVNTSSNIVVNGVSATQSESFAFTAKSDSVMRLRVADNNAETALKVNSGAFNKSSIQLNENQAAAMKNTSNGTIGFYWDTTTRIVVRGVRAYIVATDEEKALIAKHSEDLVSVYSVPSNKPALPAQVDYSIDLTDMFFEFDNGMLVSGNDITWTSLDAGAYVDNNAKTVTKLTSEISTIKASYNGEEKLIYLVTADANGEYALYKHDFSSKDVSDGKLVDTSDWTTNITGQTIQILHGGLGVNADVPGVFYIKPDSAVGKMISSFDDVAVELKSVAWGDPEFSGPIVRLDLDENDIYNESDSHVRVYIQGIAPGQVFTGDENQYFNPRLEVNEIWPSWMRVWEGDTRLNSDWTRVLDDNGDPIQYQRDGVTTLTNRVIAKGNKITSNLTAVANGVTQTSTNYGNWTVTSALKGGTVGYGATDIRNVIAISYNVFIEFSDEFLSNIAGDSSKVSLIPATKPAIPMSIGQTLDLSLVTLTDEFGNLIDGSKAEWTISDESAYVEYDEATNTVTSYSAGYVTLTATYAGNSAKVYLTVANSKGEYVIYQHTFSDGDLVEKSGYNVFTEESEWYAKNLSVEDGEDELRLGYRMKQTGSEHIYQGLTTSYSGTDPDNDPTRAYSSLIYLRPESASGIKVSSFSDFTLDYSAGYWGNSADFTGPLLRLQFDKDGNRTNYTNPRFYYRDAGSPTWLRLFDNDTRIFSWGESGATGILYSDGSNVEVVKGQRNWFSYAVNGNDLNIKVATDANYSDAFTLQVNSAGNMSVTSADGSKTANTTMSAYSFNNISGGTIGFSYQLIAPYGLYDIAVKLTFTDEEMSYLSKFVDEYAEVKVNEYEDITEYVGGSTNIAPQAPYNKAFAGWYYDEACTTPVKEEDNYTGKAYAKFVNSDVFSVKWQITNPADASRGGKVDLRLVTSVDSLKYQEVAFEIIRENDSKRQRASIKTNEVFEHIVGNGDNFEAYDPSVFTDISKYFATGRVKNTNWADWGEGTYYVTVVLTTVDGTVVRNTNATQRFKMSYDDQAIDMAEEALKAQINNLPDTVEANAIANNTGDIFYVSNDGSDSNPGTKERPFATFKKAYNSVGAGDTILFERGGTYRMVYNKLEKMDGLSIGAYGTGAKPMILGSADVKSTLTPVDSFKISETDTKQEGLNTELFTAPAGTKLYQVNLSGKLATNSDVGSIFFVEEGDKVTAADKKWFRKAAHALYDPQFDDLTEAYDFFYDFNNKVAYVLLPEDKKPADYEAIEALGLENVFIVNSDNITIENLEIRYGNFGVVVYYVDNTTLRGLEIGWIGGNRQSNLGMYNLESHSSKYTRLGNGIENWGGGSNLTIDKCYVYECYDAGITFQNNTEKEDSEGKRYYVNSEFENIKFTNNLLTRNIYNIEYFQSHVNGKDDTYIQNVLFEGNICRDPGGTAEDPMWASLHRPDKKVATNIKGSTALGNNTMLTNDPEAWLNDEEADYTLEAKEGYVSSFIIRDNIFDGSYDNSIMHFSTANKGGEPIFNNNLVVGNGDQTITVQGKAYTIKNFMNKFDTTGGSVVKSASMASAVDASARTFSTWGAVKETNTLDNTKYLLEEKKSIKVGYIGGSVTDGTNAYNWVEDDNYNADNDSWRALTTRWLKENYSDASVVEIMASQGGTASYWGFHRLETDLLVYKPDLVFVEFGVNDVYSGLTGTDSALYMEGIVRKLRTANPNVDIVFVIVADSANYKEDTDNIKAHYAVAKHYGIPVIDVRNSLAADYDLSDKAVWDKFFSDTVHPSKAGYAAYAGYVAEAMEGFLAEAEANFQEVTMPTSDYVSNLATSSEFRRMDKVTIEDKDGNPVELVSSDATRLVKVDEVAMLSDGDVIKTSFTGKTLGFYLDSYSAGLADGSKVSFTINIDGKKTVVAPQYKGGYNIEYIALDNLAPGRHTVEITINTTELNPIAIGALLIAK